MRLPVSLVFIPLLFLIPTAQSSELPLSPVQQRIAAAEKKVQTSPNSPQSYNDLAFALCRSARDTGDIAVYRKTEAAIERSLQLSTGNYEAQKLEVAVLLGKHEFTQALTLATDLNHRVPDDVGGWGLLVDTNVALGNYAEAERAAQWILDLRPGSSLGFEKAGGLRELFGDLEGGVEFFEEANRRTSQNDSDQHAWLLTQMARLELTAGHSDRAGEFLSEALKWFPDSQLVLAGLAKMRMVDGHYSEAASLFERRYRGVPSLQNLYDWAEALDKAGRRDKSTMAFAQFEREARAQTGKPYNANLELIYFYADHKSEPVEALRLAAEESRARHDVSTLDAYARALYNNGRFSEAEAQINRAMAIGVRDSLYFCHAAQIAAKTNDTGAVAKYTAELKGVNASACPIQQTMQSAREVVP